MGLEVIVIMLAMMILVLVLVLVLAVLVIYHLNGKIDYNRALIKVLKTEVMGQQGTWQESKTYTPVGHKQ
jgi:hypothetical protein